MNFIDSVARGGLVGGERVGGGVGQKVVKQT